MRRRTGRIVRAVVVLALVAGMAGASASAGASQGVLVATARAGAAAVVDAVAPAAVSEPAVRGASLQLVPQPVRRPGCDSKRVFTVGDSLTDGIVNYGGNYHSRLATAGFTPTSVYEVGRFTSWGITKLRAAISGGSVGGIVVAALGTNDAYKTPPSYVASFRSRVDEFMQAVGPDRTVIWVNFQFGKPGTATYADMVAMASPFNQVLQDRALAWPNLVVLDWNSTPNRQYLGPDQVHYSTTGYRNRAIAIVDAVMAVSCPAS